MAAFAKRLLGRLTKARRGDQPPHPQQRSLPPPERELATAALFSLVLGRAPEPTLDIASRARRSWSDELAALLLSDEFEASVLTTLVRGDPLPHSKLGEVPEPGMMSLCAAYCEGHVPFTEFDASEWSSFLLDCLASPEILSAINPPPLWQAYAQAAQARRALDLDQSGVAADLMASLTALDQAPPALRMAIAWIGVESGSRDGLEVARNALLPLTASDDTTELIELRARADAAQHEKGVAPTTSDSGRRFRTAAMRDLDQDPVRPEFRRRAAIAMVLDGDVDAARCVLDDLARADPTNPDVSRDRKGLDRQSASSPTREMPEPKTVRALTDTAPGIVAPSGKRPARSVLIYPLYRDNPYIEMLFSALDERFTSSAGSIDDAIEAQRALAVRGERQVFHVQWDEHVVRRMTLGVEAMAAARYFVDKLREFHGLGGAIVWTVHNAAPHERHHLDAFKVVRQGLVTSADRVLVHTQATVPHLDAYGGVVPSQLVHLPHPSYHGFYQDLGDGEPALDGHTLLIFGKIRRYKKIDAALSHYQRQGFDPTKLRIHVAGEPFTHETYDQELLEAYGATPGVSLDFRRIQSPEVSALFRDHAALVLPYGDFLTSGVLLAALTCGCPVIAPALPQVREVLPESAQRWLFRPGDTADLFAKASAFLALSADERRLLRSELRQHAGAVRPDVISRQLGDVYDGLAS